MLILGNSIDMDANASDSMVIGLVRRLERDGHYLTPKTVDRIHAMITDCIPDERVSTGSQTEAAKAIRERMEREP